MINLLSGYRGSKAHGTFIEGVSDIDTFSIVAAPIENYFGLGNFESSTSGEHLTFEIRKFIRLLLKSNPSALELLFTDTLKVEHEAAQELVNNRYIFLSKKIVAPVLGHATRLIDRLDGKGLSHLIRLLLMAEECLKGGDLIINRTGFDADILLEIKQDRYKPENIKAVAEMHIRHIKELEISSTLRVEPDKKEVERILVNILRRIHVS